MKKLLLPFLAAVLATNVQAGDEVVSLSTTTTGVGVLRGGGNMYRPMPRGGSVANLTVSERYRAVIYRPTQHFYFKDSVVSYRFAPQELSDIGNEYGGNYHGPIGAQFVPSQHPIAPDARIRTFASVSKRPQPGVPMVSRTTKITAEAKSSPVTSIQLATAR